jgi:CPA2 family monovalent cation:H+ antiporter-2
VLRASQSSWIVERRRGQVHEFPILMNITLSVAAAFVGGFIARLFKFPTMVGYLLIGVAIGPFTPGFFGQVAVIQHLAELGVIFLLFGVGLRFSWRDLWAVRSVAVPGVVLQLVLITALGVLLTRLWGWSLAAGVLLGMAMAIASTVVMVRNFMDQGLLHTRAGQISMGWLVLEDVITVFVLVVLPVLTTNLSGMIWQVVSLALLKAGVFAVLMLVGGARVIPWLLKQIAYLRSRELFIVAIVVVTVGTAIAASALFDISLALGAFLAGVVIKESLFSYQVEAEVLPLREIFGVLFFVSIGMLVDPALLLGHAGEVLALVAVIVVGKFLLTLLFGALVSQPAHTMLVVAAGRSQIGEFSFLLGQAGVAAALLTQEQYSLILTGAILSIALNPVLFRALPWIEARLRMVPALWSVLNRDEVVPVRRGEIAAMMRGHVVIVGYGRVGRHIVRVLSSLKVPCLVIDLDVSRVVELERRGVPALYGDAANSDILTHAGVARAWAVVVTVPDETAAYIVVAAVRTLAARVPLVVRAVTREGVHRLLKLGANEVTHPELEGGLNIVRQTLAFLGYPGSETEEYLSAVRHDHYDLSISTVAEWEALVKMRKTPPPHIQLVWLAIPEASPLIGQSLAQINLPVRTGARVVAIEHDRQVITDLESTLRVHPYDVLGVIGTADQIHATEKMFESHCFDTRACP